MRTLTGFFADNESSKANSLIFKILYELDNLEDNSFGERKKEQLLRRKLSGNNLGGRPKISPLKESLVIRLRNEGIFISINQITNGNRIVNNKKSYFRRRINIK